MKRLARFFCLSSLPTLLHNGRFLDSSNHSRFDDREGAYPKPGISWVKYHQHPVPGKSVDLVDECRHGTLRIDHQPIGERSARTPAIGYSALEGRNQANLWMRRASFDCSAGNERGNILHWRLSRSQQQMNDARHFNPNTPVCGLTTLASARKKGIVLCAPANKAPSSGSFPLR